LACSEPGEFNSEEKITSLDVTVKKSPDKLKVLALFYPAPKLLENYTRDLP
jgi:hypothetical protein